MKEAFSRVHLHRTFPWKIASAKWADGVFIVHGWALVLDGNSEIYTITANEMPPSKMEKDLPTVSLGTVFPYWPNASRAGFKATFTDLPVDCAPVLRLSHALSLEQLNDMTAIYTPPRVTPSRVPSADQLRRTQGDTNETTTTFTATPWLEKSRRLSSGIISKV